MTPTPDTLPKLTTDCERITELPGLIASLDMIHDETGILRFDAKCRAPMCLTIPREIVRRCNDYPALAARLERAMGLLRRASAMLNADWKAENKARIDAGGPIWSDEYFRKTNVHPWHTQVNDLLAEHERETRP